MTRGTKFANLARYLRLGGLSGMTVQRLTLLPQPARAAPAAERTEVGHVLPEITSITRFAQGGKWRTEAMRSYDRPLHASPLV